MQGKNHSEIEKIENSEARYFICCFDDHNKLSCNVRLAERLFFADVVERHFYGKILLHEIILFRSSTSFFCLLTSTESIVFFSIKKKEKEILSLFFL
jgi:hypothetical protein